MTPDGSKVFFTSEEHLTGEDPDHGGASLYMWSEKGEEEGHPLTLISKANPGSPAEAGNTAACNPALAKIVQSSFSHEARMKKFPGPPTAASVPYSGYSYAAAQRRRRRQRHLRHRHRLRKRRHLLLLPRAARRRPRRPRPAEPLRLPRRQAPVRHHPHPEDHCIAAASSRMARISTCLQRRPDRPHRGHPRRHPYGLRHRRPAHLLRKRWPPRDVLLHPVHRRHRLRFLQPRRPARHRRRRSLQDGLFITDDGRTFFSTTESLVPQDTNEGEDVYEFVDGRPQLITPGTGTATVPAAKTSARSTRSPA